MRSSEQGQASEVGSVAVLDEPTKALPLRWGTWQSRSIAGAALIICGLIGLQAASTNFLLPLITGTAAHVAGWWILPSAGWRRHVVVFPCGVQIWLLLTGPQSMWTLIVPYLAWMLVRHRPLRSYVTGLFVIAYGVLAASMFSEYSQLLPALAGGLAVIAVSAWIARKIAGVRRIHSQRTPSFR